MSTALPLSSFGSVVVVAFWSVLLAELVCDRTLYGIASLSLRFRAGVVFAGITLAFAAKMLAAVLLAEVLVRLHVWSHLISAVGFFLSAGLLWCKEGQPVQPERALGTGTWRALSVCCATILLTEWGDPSQLAVAALTLKAHLSLGPWLGGTLAMATKGGLAVTAGMKLRDRLPQGMLRAVATASLSALGLLALGGVAFD